MLLPGHTTVVHIHVNDDIHTYKQDRQCTYNVTLKRVHETTVAVEK
jgi:hypothetical protein